MKKRKINYICRFIPSVIVTAIFGGICYVATITCMLFVNWDLEYASLKTIHTEMGDFCLTMMGMKKDEVV
jgi:hypothetical protein